MFAVEGYGGNIRLDLLPTGALLWINGLPQGERDFTSLFDVTYWPD